MTLKQLEDHLGQKLFLTDRKNRLTELGQQIFALAQHQIRQYEDTVEAIETTAKSPQGILRIASVPSIAKLVLPEALNNLIEQHEGLRIELRDTDSESVVDALLRGKADLGLASGRHTLNGIAEYPLFEDPFGLICAAEHPLAKGESDLSFDAVEQAQFVANDLCRQIDHPRMQSINNSALLTVFNTLSLIGMVKSAKWVTVLPYTVVQSFPEDLQFRTIKGLNTKRWVCGLVGERSPSSDVARNLLEIIAVQREQRQR